MQAKKHPAYSKLPAIGLGLTITLVAVLSVLSWSTAASPLLVPTVPPFARYLIWGTIVDSVTGLPPEGAAVRVYRRDPVTGEFWGINYPDDIMTRPNESGYWSVAYDGPIEWLVVKLFYEPGWADLIVEAPSASSTVGQRVDMRNPAEGLVGPFNFTLVQPTPAPTDTETPIPTDTPTVTPTNTAEPTVPVPTRPARLHLPMVVQLWQHP